MEIELDPIAFLFTSRARAHGRGRDRGRLDYDIPRSKQGSIIP